MPEAVSFILLTASIVFVKIPSVVFWKTTEAFSGLSFQSGTVSFRQCSNGAERYNVIAIKQILIIMELLL